MTEPKVTVITPDMVRTYAASAAVQELVNAKVLTQEQVEALAKRADQFLVALLLGKQLHPNAETGRYDIIDPTEDTDAPDDGTLVIGD